jgi:hypothetical protein
MFNIAMKYAKQFSSHLEWHCRDFLGMNYDQIIEFITPAKTSGRYTKREEAASLSGIGVIAKALGGTNIQSIAFGWDTIERLAEAGRRPIEGFVRGGDRCSLNDHAFAVQRVRQLIGIVARPYVPAVSPRDLEHIATSYPGITIWTTPPARCSWNPGSTQTYVLANRSADRLESLGFTKIEAA